MQRGLKRWLAKGRPVSALLVRGGTGPARTAMPSACGSAPRGCGVVRPGAMLSVSLSAWPEAFTVICDGDYRPTGQERGCVPVCGALCVCQRGFG